MRMPQYSPNGLPILNPDMFSRRVKITLTNVDDTLVFYTHLLNQSFQWGILWKPVNHIKFGQSLCPQSYNGCAITKARYLSMAAILYEFLSKNDTIPIDRTGPRQIVSQLADANDGYLVLYAMLQVVHPDLNKDAIFDMPGINHCVDIHEYATKCDTFFKYEKCAGRPYAPCEKVVRFLRGLNETYTPAIARLQTSLDNWQPWDIKGPAILQLLQLPAIIDRILQQNTSGHLTIRMAQIRQRNNDIRDKVGNNHNNRSIATTITYLIDLTLPSTSKSISHVLIVVYMAQTFQLFLY